MKRMIIIIIKNNNNGTIDHIHNKCGSSTQKLNAKLNFKFKN